MWFAKGSSARTFAWIAAGGVLCSGCFNYVTSELDTVQPGQVVRVHLSQELADLGLASPDLSLNGTLMAGDAERLILRVPVGERLAGVGTRTLGQDVTIPAARITGLERREFSRSKTGLVAAGAVVATVAAILGFGQGTPNAGPIIREDPDEEAGSSVVRWWTSVFSIRVP